MARLPLSLRVCPAAVVLSPLSRGLLDFRVPAASLSAALVLLVLERSGAVTGALTAVAFFALVAAPPLAALAVNEANRNGRLDQLRLAGLPARSLLIAAVVGGAVPILTVGVICLGVAAAGVGVRPGEWILLGVGTSVSAACGVMALAAGLAWRVGIGDGLAALTTAAAVLGAVLAPRLAALAATMERSTLAATAAVGLAAALAGMPWIGDALRRPVLAARFVPDKMRLAALVPVDRLPDVARGLRATHTAGALAMIVVAVTAAALAAWPPVHVPGAAREVLAFSLGYVSLALAHVVALLQSRADASSGRLDIVRLAPRPSCRAMALDVLSRYMAFVPAITLGMLVIAAVGTTSRAPFGLALGLALAAPAVSVEGWLSTAGRSSLGVASALPLVLAFARFGRETGGGVLALICVAWLPWKVGELAFARPHRPMLDSRMTAVTLGLVALAVFWPAPSPAQLGDVAGPMMAGWLLLVAPILPRTRPYDRVAAPAMVAAVAAASIVVGPSLALPRAVGAMTAVVALWLGWRVDAAHPAPVSLAARVAVAYTLAFAAIWLGRVMAEPLRPADPREQMLQDVRLAAAHFGVLVVAGALALLGAKLAARRARAQS